MPNGTFDMEKGDHNYAPETVPEKGFFYMPVRKCLSMGDTVIVRRSALGRQGTADPTSADKKAPRFPAGLLLESYSRD
jgi:hypothetical protein